LGEARELNSKNEAIIEVQNKRLQLEQGQEQGQSTTTTTTQTFDQETLEFEISYNEALQSYVQTLQAIMDNNGVIYPKFIYQELLEGE
jgi:bisphosphoglycerate-dependent phosphoglycerate mutase